MAINSALIHRVAGHWPKEKTSDTLTLDFDARHRRRIRLKPDRGEDILLDLPRTVAMADGDGVQLDDGRWLMIQAATETIVEIRHRDLGQLVCLAWHLGNRHIPTEIRNESLRIRPDHVIEQMLTELGAVLKTIEVPFQPERGAYASRNHHHGHGE